MPNNSNWKKGDHDFLKEQGDIYTRVWREEREGRKRFNYIINIQTIGVKYTVTHILSITIISMATLETWRATVSLKRYPGTFTTSKVQNLMALLYDFKWNTIYLTYKEWRDQKNISNQDLTTWPREKYYWPSAFPWSRVL